MDPKAVTPRPSTSEYLRMISGPQVDIYVGQGQGQKHYRLPKLLLCHYSDYFDRCFNGNFAEGKSQRLDLPEDEVKNFEILVEYMLHRTIEGSIITTEEGREAVERCMEVLEYADKYQMREVCHVVLGPLEKAIESSPAIRDLRGINLQPLETHIVGSDIELVFRVTEPGDPLRALVTKGALGAMNTFRGAMFEKEEEEVDGFAAEMLRQIRSCLKWSTKFQNPISYQAVNVPGIP